MAGGADALDDGVAGASGTRNIKVNSPGGWAAGGGATGGGAAGAGGGAGGGALLACAGGGGCEPGGATGF
jgi:hypothetical protein